MEMTLEAVRKNLEYLEHYGVKGQRWGIRRTPEQLGHILKKKNARHYGKYNAAVKRISELHGGKSIDQLSSKEKKKIAKAIEKAEAAVGKIQANEKKFAPKIEKAEARQAKQEQKSAEKEAKAAAKKEAAQAKAEEKAQKEQAKNEKLKAKLMKDPNWDEVYANRNLFSNQELNDITTRMNSEKRMRDALNDNSTFNRMADKMKTAANVAGAGLDLYNKAKDIKGIFDAGKQDKAYAEIRQLMADGKYADVVKKSTVIADKDVENFSKRKKLLDDLRGPQPKDSKDTKDTKSTKDADASDNNKGHAKGIKGMKIGKRQDKPDNEDPEILKGVVEDAPKGTNESRSNKSVYDDIIDVPFHDVETKNLIETRDKYLPIVLGDIGDFKLSELK